MRFDIITLFPEFFAAFEALGVTGRAVQDGIVEVVTWNPRDFATSESRRVDDRPYGGGPGMVMQAAPLEMALQAAKAAAKAGENVPASLMSPQGQRMDQAAVAQMAGRQRMILICGRYEGIDQRFIDRHVDEQWSLGDYVLSGGELAAAVLMDSVTRLLPGVLGDEDSARQDSFSDGLLDHPHYTRPECLDDASGAVPPVLLSGDHGRISEWRRMQSLGRTWLYRPDLLEETELNHADRALLARFKQENKGAQLNCPEEKQ